MAFWLRHKGKMQGNNYQIDKEPIIDLPVYCPSSQEQNKMADLVDQILAYLKLSNISNQEKAKIGGLEHRIDELVYKLYNLTDEEVKIVGAG